MFVALVAAWTNRWATTRILLAARCDVLFHLFFWPQVIVDNSMASSLTNLSVQGIILVASYILLILSLIMQRPRVFEPPGDMGIVYGR